MSRARHNKMWVVYSHDVCTDESSCDYYFTVRSKAVIMAKRLLLKLLKDYRESFSSDQMQQRLTQFEERATKADPEKNFIYDIYDDGTEETTVHIEPMTFSDHLV